jgi:hypothetical protein
VGERGPGESSKQLNQLLRWRCSGRYRKLIARADERAAIVSRADPSTVRT